MFRLFNKREACNLHNCKIRKYIFVIKSSCFNFTRCKSYYQVLGLNSNASSKDIKSAYYELSLKFHPDKNKGSPESVEKFREISEAYEVLGNPQKRLSYDQGKDSSNYSQNYTTKEGYYYRPYNTRQRHQGPYTGKTRDFDYDEHFRQHYEKQRMYEYEYIKRRWEAEFRRRYPDRNPEEGYYRNQYQQTSSKKSREEFEKARREFYEEYSRLFTKKFQVLYFFLPFWVLFLVIPFVADLFNPDETSPKRYHGPIYYKVKDEKHNGQNNE